MAAAGSLVVVAGSGAWLARYYAPARPRAVAPDRFVPVLGGGWIHEAHVWGAIALQVSVVVLAVALAATVLRRRAPSVDWRSVAAAALLAGAVAVGVVTADGLRWHNLALWAVTIGGDYRGVWTAAFSDTVRFILIDGEGEVSPFQYEQRVVAHLFAAPSVVLVAALLLAVNLWGPSRPNR